MKKALTPIASPALDFCMKNVYIPAGLELTKEPIWEKESKQRAYEASRIGLNGKNILLRTAKNTANRPGAFVTLWKRDDVSKKIIPLDADDKIDSIFIFVTDRSKASDKVYKGQFFFDKKILLEKKIMSAGNQRGKLAIRVFPPWSEALAEESIEGARKKSVKIKKTQSMSSAAKKTQAWQLHYFVSFTDKQAIDLNRVSRLFYPESKS